MPHTITLRDATPADAPFIAHAVIAALHEGEMPAQPFATPVSQVLVQAIVQEPILYSYRHTRMADVDGQPAGCFVTYDGALFLPLRPLTYQVLGQALGFTGPLPDADPTLQQEPETRPGEFYLDSLAVLPQHRQSGVGRLLVVDAICQGRNRGHHRFTGLVATDSPHLLRFYQSEGLQPVGQQLLFGTPYHRLLLEL